MIIEKASAGHDDHVKAALDLFVDFIAVLVRLTVLLVWNGHLSVSVHFSLVLYAALTLYGMGGFLVSVNSRKKCQ